MVMDEIELKNELSFIVAKLGAAHRSLSKLHQYPSNQERVRDAYEQLNDELAKVREEIKNGNLCMA